MIKLIKLQFIIFALMYASLSAADTLSGTADIYDPLGNSIMGYQPPVTAEIDVTNKTISISPFMFFGMNLSASGELLDEGSHTRSIGTIVVGANQVGAFLYANWGFSSIPMFIVWDKYMVGSSYSLTPVDSDGDGVPGHAFTTGPFPGFTLTYGFTSPDALPPGVVVNLAFQGSTSRTCDRLGGTSVAFAAGVVLQGDTSLQSVNWSLDGEPAGTGSNIDLLIPVGAHTVSVTASTTTGQSDTDEVTFQVYDWTAPTVAVQFTDERDGSLITSIDGNNMYFVVPHVTATDNCDASPDTHSVASPVYAVSDGFVLKVQGNTGDIKMPASGIEVRVHSSDDAGNSRSDSFILPVIN